MNFMKKNLLLAAGATLVLATSCRKDDEDLEAINGTWYIAKYVTVYGNGTTDTDTPDACESKTNIILDSDSNFTINGYYQDAGNCKSELNKGKYVYDSSSKSLKFTHSDGETEYYDVESLSSSELVLIEEEGDFDDDGKNDKDLVYLRK